MAAGDDKRTRREIILAAAAVGLGLDAAPGAAAPAPASVGEAQPAGERAAGIGGFFFRAKDPKALALWYFEHLGVDPVPTRAGEKAWQQAAGPTAFVPFPENTDYFGVEHKPWMLNFRVRSLDTMTAQLRAAGIAVNVDPQRYPNGRFAHLADPEGNPLELWEPAG